MVTPTRTTKRQRRHKKASFDDHLGKSGKATHQHHDVFAFIIDARLLAALTTRISVFDCDEEGMCQYEVNF